MTLAEYVALVVLLVGFATGVALVVWGLLDDQGDDGHGWGGQGDEPDPEPVPGPSDRELASAFL